VGREWKVKLKPTTWEGNGNFFEASGVSEVSPKKIMPGGRWSTQTKNQKRNPVSNWKIEGARIFGPDVTISHEIGRSWVVGGGEKKKKRGKLDRNRSEAPGEERTQTNTKGGRKEREAA